MISINRFLLCLSFVSLPAMAVEFTTFEYGFLSVGLLLCVLLIFYSLKLKPQAKAKLKYEQPAKKSGFSSTYFEKDTSAEDKKEFEVTSEEIVESTEGENTYPPESDGYVDSELDEEFIDDSGGAESSGENFGFADLDSDFEPEEDKSFTEPDLQLDNDDLDFKNNESIEMSETIRVAIEDAKRTASEAQQSVNEASTKTKSVLSDVESAYETIAEISQTSQELMEVVTNLKDNSSEIGSIIEVIQSIAEQTNLLALNAAIEAARAGEQGRGFAVVADEVRGLAQRTQESVKTIQSRVGGIQKEAEKTFDAMEKNSAGFSKVNEQISGSVETIKELVDVSGNAKDAVEEVTASLTQCADKI